MNRSLTSLFAAFEAFLVVAIGIGISLAPLTILWGVQYGFAPDWWGFWRAAVDIWLVGHGVDIVVTLDATVAAATGLPGAGDPFPITVAALGFGLLTALLGMRAGRRIAQTTFRLLGELVALGVFAALSLGVTASATYPAAQPHFVQGIVLPTLVFAVGLGIGSFRSPRAGGDPLRKVITTWLDEWQPQILSGVTAALRGGLSAAGVVIATASVLVGIVVVLSYAQIIALYEGLQAGALGGFALTLAQIAFIPNLVLWAVSWLVGPGFAIGTGSSVSPLATNLGPIPAVPVLGALPTGDSAFAFIGILVPVIAGFLAGALLHRQKSASSLPRTLAIGAGMGLAAGAALGLLAWASAGSAGPGRLVTIGPDPWQVALWAALEIGIAAILGMLAATRMPFRHPDDTATPPLGTRLPRKSAADSRNPVSGTSTSGAVSSASASPASGASGASGSDSSASSPSAASKLAGRVSDAAGSIGSRVSGAMRNLGAVSKDALGRSDSAKNGSAGNGSPANGSAKNNPAKNNPAASNPDSTDTDEIPDGNGGKLTR